MKRSIVASAILAVFSMGADAQTSSVTLFGVMDLGVRHSTGSLTSTNSVVSGAHSVSRIGFRGTEDLGGGNSASFWLEAGINADNGTGSPSSINNQALPPGAANGMAFNRRSTVSLAGNWGEIRLGRDISPQGWNHAAYDPFLVGVGTSQAYMGSTTLHGAIGGPTGVNTRASNAVAYWLPNTLGGFTGTVMHYLGENATASSTKNDGTGTGIRFGYRSGPFVVEAALSNTQFLTGDYRTLNIAGSWDFSIAKLFVILDKDRVENGLEGKGGLLGVTVPVGTGLVRATYSQYKTSALRNPKAQKLAVGYVHNLSKRTLLYTTYAHVRNSNASNAAIPGSTTALGRSSSGLEAGIRHAF